MLHDLRSWFESILQQSRVSFNPLPAATCLLDHECHCAPIMLYPDLLLNAAKLYIINLSTEQQSPPTTLLLVLPWMVRNHSLLVCIASHCYLPIYTYKSRLPPLSRFLTNSESDTCLELWHLRTNHRRFSQRTSLSGLYWKNLLAVWNVDKWSPKQHEEFVGNVRLPEAEKLMTLFKTN